MIGDHHQVSVYMYAGESVVTKHQLNLKLTLSLSLTHTHTHTLLYPQLPPVVQNMAFQKYSNMEQSMFARFVRLRVPTVQLDAQGRARPEICQLYNWRYTYILYTLYNVAISPVAVC